MTDSDASNTNARVPFNEIERSTSINDVLSKVRTAGGLREFDGIHCISCGEPYSNKNVYSEAGWREVKISGFCERCFDECYAV